MRINAGKGQFEDYLTTEERAAAKRAGRKKVNAKPKKPTKLKGQCPHCGMCGR